MAVADTAESSFYVPIVKTVENDDGTVTVIGKPSTEAVDFDDQIVDKDFVKRALPKWFRDWGNIREMHQPKAVGRAKDLQWDEHDEPWLVARIVDPDAVRKVREGVLQGFSIGVRGPKVVPDRRARGGRIVDGREIAEVSLVDRPANPDCRIQILKAASGGWLDCQTGTLHKAVEPSREPEPGGVPGVAGDAQLSPGPARAGDVQDPLASNSVDFDSMGNPVLQPGHVRDDRAVISVVAMDDRGVTVRVGDEEWVVPYTVESDGAVHFLTDQMVRLPYDPKALPEAPRSLLRETRGTAAGNVDAVNAAKGVSEMGAATATPPPEDKAEKRDFDPNVGGGVDRDKIPAEDFVDPERRRFPVVTPQDVEDAVHSYGRAKPKIPFEHFKERLEAIARRKGPEFVARLPKEWREGDKGGEGVEEPARKTATVADLRKAAEERLKTHGFCRKCNKLVKLGDRLSEEKATGGVHAVYRGECGHEVRRFEPDAKEDATKTADGQDGHPKTGMGAAAGDAPGNRHGERPAHTDPIERQEDDILRRLLAAVRELAAAQGAEEQGRGTEGEEQRALAKVKELVDAYTAQQLRERLEETGKWEQRERRAAEEPLEEAVKAAVQQAVRKALMSVPEVRKAVRVDHKRRLKAATERLAMHIDELPDDPLEDHERGVAEGGHGRGHASADGSAPKAAGWQVNPDAHNPDHTATQAGNSDRFAPVRSGDPLERIREDVREIGDLARALEEAEEPFERGEHRDHPGQLQDRGRATPAVRLPEAADNSLDLTRGNGYRTPRGGEDYDRMHKAAALDAHVTEYLAKTAQALAGVTDTLAALQKKVDQVAHMARPPMPPVLTAAEHPDLTGQAAREEADRALKAAINQLPPQQREIAYTQLIALARGQRR